MKFQTVICGGTFDLLHAGHKYFLQEILKQSEKLIIGLTSDKYIVNNKPNRNIASFRLRSKKLEEFLNKLGAEKRFTIIPIDDFYGPLLSSEVKVDAIAISEHYNNAVKINGKRKSRGLKRLTILKIGLKQSDTGGKVSSSRIRKGEIDNEGRNLILPPTLRPLLQDVWGEMLEDVPENINPKKVITVGDVTTSKFRNLKIIPKLSIVDFKVERKEIKKSFFKDEEIIKVKNPPGTISDKLQEEIFKSVKNEKKNTVIIVEGEEDLSVLPALLYAPFGFEVYYGQPIRIAKKVNNEVKGWLVRVIVNNKNKKKAKNLIDKFKRV